MRQGRPTIARLLGAVAFSGIVFAGLRSGSNDWFKLIYSLTFATLVHAAIAARHRGAFWHGFAIAGWAYFLVGFGPWIDSPPGRALRGVNRNLVTSVVLEIVSGTMSRGDLPAVVVGGPPGSTMIFDLRWANRDGIVHSALTILFACLGGSVSRALARRPTPEGSDPPD